VHDLENLCRRLSSDPRVQAIYLFGSAAAGKARGDSDIDLAVLTGERMGLGDELRLRAIAVEELRRDDIDFVILDNAPPLLRYEVITRGRRLFARDAAAVDMFEHRSIMTYMDSAHLRRMVSEILREATR
jgi:predicted nucleotidyltransferase